MRLDAMKAQELAKAAEEATLKDASLNKENEEREKKIQEQADESKRVLKNEAELKHPILQSWHLSI